MTYDGSPIRTDSSSRSTGSTAGVRAPRRRPAPPRLASARWLEWVAVLGSIFAGAPALGQPADDSQITTSGTARLAADIRAYLTAPLHARREQWLGFGAAAASIAAAYQQDQRVRERFGFTPLTPSSPAKNSDARDAAPALLAVGGSWVAAALRGDGGARSDVHAMLEAAAFSSIATFLLKDIAGRERPYFAGDPTLWRQGGKSFPSGHVTAAFAIGAVFAEAGDPRRRWLRRAAGYGIGALTTYGRIEHDAHWTSDTVAGAAVGLATARFVLKRHDELRHAELALVPIERGLALSYGIPLR
jgi:membrane-associated phospholipid phosphatase